MARKQKMKVYHGIPKSITDEHTIFYESMESMPEGFTQTSGGVPTFKYGVTGIYPSYANCTLPLKQDINSTSPITIDLWVHDMTKADPIIVELEDANGNRLRVQKASTSGKLYFVAYINSTWKAEALLSNSVTPIGTFHVRYVADIPNKLGRVYINGKLVGSTSLVDILNAFSNFTGKFTKILFNSAKFSDLHVSNIDRGDYFPNLPQDFIEGKAIIKPRMGQQQIKGDPMYSQVTNLKVPSESSWGVYYNPTASSDGLYTSFDNPELSVIGTNTWASDSKIKIKGLNGEVISGVIDTDTALAKVTKSNLNTWNILTLDLDDVSKFSVGDTIVLYVADTGDYTSEATIQSIDTENKVITLASKLLASHGGGAWGVVDLSQNPNHYVFETTLSSSSPTVKTKEGTNVVGTWSGLGTKEATFTLGANTDITGQDLYVTYALTMPKGNSDFPELPYSIEKAWGENGVEMKPVSEIVIVDDFRGKVRGNLKDCSHTSYVHLGTTLKLPSEITGNYSTGFEEIADYFRLEKLDGNPKVSEAGFLNGIPQQLYKFNIVDIVERKLGCSIPGANKVQWVRDNLDKITLDWCGYGTNHGGNRTTIQNLKGGSWITSAHYYHSTVTQVSINYIDSFDIRIDSDGFFYILVQTEASDGNTKSVVYTDYIAVNVKLKIEKGYEALYCENTRAREDVCNPVLVQKETKTVKRYLPSKEIFSTECTRHSYKDNLKSEVGKCLAVSTNKLVTTSGTSTYATGGQGVDTYADKFILPGDYKWYDFDNTPLQVSPSDMVSVISHSVKLPIIRYWGGRCYHGAGSTTGSNGTLDGCQTITTVSDSTNVKQYEMYYALKAVNNELVLTVQTGIREANNKYQPSLTNVYDYKLPNRPLIK